MIYSGWCIACNCVQLHGIHAVHLQLNVSSTSAAGSTCAAAAAAIIVQGTQA